MKYLYPFFCLFFAFSSLQAQLVINELDADTASTDDLEFVEIKSETPYFNLDGYIVVFFNGSESGADSSYYTLDLGEYSTDVNGLLLIGSSKVSPVPQYIISESVIQNGADAVAIYKASYMDFMPMTVATQVNLIDALVYDTSDADDEGLMALLGVSEQINENQNGNKDFESIQRNDDGSYTVKAPTPRRLNNGGGVDQIGINFSLDAEAYIEGDTFEIVFTTEENLPEETTINFSLLYGSFNSQDYTGSTTIMIAEGTSSATATFTLLDDELDEGDEELFIQLGNLPEGLIPLRDRVKIRIVDNDFTIADWGSPLQSTYDEVRSTQPTGYYSPMEGLSGDNLRQAMQDIIANPAIVRSQTYADIIDILKEADQNPENSNQVWLVYSEVGTPKLDFQTGSDSDGKWNREHTFPRSRGGFYSNEYDDIADGKEAYVTTNADSIRHGNSDAHALRAVDGNENSSRGNQNYGEYTGPQNTAGSFYGDVARSVFYMAVRYNGLEIVDGFPTTSDVGELGDLSTLLEWHRNDPADDFEMNRNNVVYEWQYNRNPFIDNPELVEYIWGNKKGEVWHENLGLKKTVSNKIMVYPNPTSSQLWISGIERELPAEILSIEGRILATTTLKAEEPINLNLAAGTYFIRIYPENKPVVVKKISIQ